MENIKNSSVLFLFMIVVALISVSCDKDCLQVKGQGQIQTKSITVNNFAGLNCELDANVNIIQDSIQAVYITTYDNYQPLIHARVSNGILFIDSDKSLEDDEVKIDIHVSRLCSITLEGSGNIHSSGRFSSVTMNVQLIGSGTIDFSGDVTTLNAIINGSGKIILNGSCENSKMNITGSGKIHGYSMECTNNDVKISGSGTMETFVTENLKVNISGSGSVYYLGNPGITTDISGSGDLVHIH